MAKKKQAASKRAAGMRGGGPEPMAVLYRLDAGTQRGDAVRAVLRGCGLHVRTVAADQLDVPAGALCGVPGMRMPKRVAGPGGDGDAAGAPDDAFVLFAHLAPGQLDAVLAAMRQADAQVPCKAQLTAHNRLWPFGVLVREVAREHALMSQAPPSL